MADNMKPVEPVFKTDNLFDLVRHYDKAGAKPGDMSLADMKRSELFHKMKSEQDKRDYMIIFNALMVAVMLVGLFHFIKYSQHLGVIVFIISLGYFIFVRRRLTQATVRLNTISKDIDAYLWEGFYLKEMRLGAVKLAYLIFFPFFLVMIGSFIEGAGVTYFWTNISMAFLMSAFAWLMFFMDDQITLNSLESELATIEYL